MPDSTSQPPASAPSAPEPVSGTAWVSAASALPATSAPAETGNTEESVGGVPDDAATLSHHPHYLASAQPDVPPAVPELPPLPPLRSADGRLELTDVAVTVRGQEFLLRELERADVAPVKWILWYLLGGLGLASVMIAFLQNWLRTGPAMLGMALTGLLLAYGHRGTNRLRLHRLGREAAHFALPGELPPWQRLVAELNRRIFRLHDHDARVAAHELAAHDEALRQAALAAQLTADAGGVYSKPGADALPGQQPVE